MKWKPPVQDVFCDYAPSKKEGAAEKKGETTISRCPLSEAISNEDPLVLSDVDIHFIRFCRKLEYGELEVEVISGEPAKATVAKRDIDFRKSTGEIILPWEGKK
jgi:hypothetical protein